MRIGCSCLKGKILREQNLDSEENAGQGHMDGYCIFYCFALLGYQEALAKFTLKKFLLLVLFLDKAKTTYLIGYNPCLFCKDSDYKVCK